MSSFRKGPIQTELFSDIRSADSPNESPVEGRVRHQKIHVSRATFKGGLDEPIHRWFRLTPSFAPDLVRYLLDTLAVDNRSVVLDPFCGAGTTPIECRRLGLCSYGFEINPLLHFVGSTSLHWDLSSEQGHALLSRILESSQRDKDRLALLHVEDTGLCLPKIHNVYRWWRADVLKDILVLKSNIDGHAPETPWRNFFRLALAAILVPDLTNVTLGRLQLHFIDRREQTIDVFAIFERHALTMLSDLRHLAGKNYPPASVVHTDATCPDLPPAPPADIVITSPPYPNRYSYVWNTRPHLYLLDFFHEPRDASELDKKTIGGTWGTATSMLSKGIIEAETTAVRDAVGEAVAQLRQLDPLMANYVMKYFNMLARQIIAMERAVGRRVKIAYVVGNSRLKGVYIESDVMLGKILEGLKLGYRTTHIERFRKRHSGVDLYESIVFAERQ